jgi:acetyltransferase-like isoleucine patch superfamily enzyme
MRIDMLDKLKRVGSNVRISELCVISRPELVEIGSHIAIDMWTYISTQLIMSDYIHIAPSVSIIGGAPAKLTMGSFTNIGSGGRIVCATDDFSQGLISPVVPIEHRTVINKPIIFDNNYTYPNPLNTTSINFKNLLYLNLDPYLFKSSDLANFSNVC